MTPRKTSISIREQRVEGSGACRGESMLKRRRPKLCVRPGQPCYQLRRAQSGPLQPGLEGVLTA